MRNHRARCAFWIGRAARMPQSARMISPRGVRAGLMKRTTFRLIAGSVLMLAIALGFVQGAGAQDSGASLTVHHRLCGDNYQGGDPFTECHDVLVGTSFDFTID